jgi:hypothetical protein
LIGTPVLAGSASTASSAASYPVPATAPVPPGAAVVVFAGAAGATAATGVTDTQGNTYALSASSTSGEYLQAFTATAVTGLNPLAGDSWTVTFAAANAQNKNILAVTVAGCAAADAAVAAHGSSASPSATGTAAVGNEAILACVQNANAGGTPSFPSTLTSLAGLAPSGQQVTSPAYGYVTRAGGVTASASITSAAWAMVMVTLTAAAPVALGSGSSPSGGAWLPPYPVLPDPVTWAPGDQMLTPPLRADPGNALLLLANPPLVIAGQTTTVQAVPNSAVTALTLDTELLDTWQSHMIPDSAVSPPLAGWYLAEGYAFLNDTVTATVVTAGITVTQNGAATSSDGAKTSDNGVNFPIPNVADLVQADPATGDTIALYCWQNSGGSRSVASAWLKTEWVAASSGTAITSPVPAAGWTPGATTLLAAVSAGATSVLVSDPTGVVAGGTIALDYGNAAAEDVAVTVATTLASGQTIGITACAYPHPAGAPVSVPVAGSFADHQIRDKILFLSYRPIARLSTQGTPQSLPSQAWPAGTAITWAPPAVPGDNCVDSFGGWSSGAPTRYTFPVSGTYYLYGQVYLTDASSPVLVSAGLAISGGTIYWGDRTLSAGSTSQGVCATARRVLRVTAGQYAEVYGSQGSGGSLAVKALSVSHCRLIAVWRGF